MLFTQSWLSWRARAGQRLYQMAEAEDEVRERALDVFRHALLRHLFDRSTKPEPEPEQEFGELREATEAEKVDGATCRICFYPDGSGPLVAPCHCIGSQQWVHLGCLQRWMRTADRAGRREHARVCSVCTMPFNLPLPPPPTVAAQAGSLLVATPRLGGNFRRTCVLLTQVTERGAHGVILNLPHEPSDELRTACEAACGDGSAVASRRVQLTWRRGGPVCSGRLGVVGYAVLHDLRAASATSIEVVREVVRASGGDAGDHAGIEAGDGDTDDGARGLADGPADGAAGAEVTDAAANDAGADLGSAVAGGAEGAVDRGDYGRIVYIDGANNSSQFDATNVEPSCHSASDLPTALARLRREGAVESPLAGGQVYPSSAFIFMGYCRWGRNQLAQEFEAGKWGLCPSRVEDVLDVPCEAMWDSLWESGRLRTHEDEEEDERL